MILCRVAIDSIRSRVRLPARLWANGVAVGDRVIVEGDGQILRGVIEADVDKSPIVMLEAKLDSTTRVVTVRTPRSAT